MNKQLLALSLGLLSYSALKSYTVYLKNETPNLVYFFVHSSLATCCYGCEVGGACEVRLKAGESGQYKFTGTCVGACIKCVATRIWINPPHNTRYTEATMDLEKSAAKMVGETTGAGVAAGVAGAGAAITLSPVGSAAAVGLGTLGGLLGGTYRAINFQCTSMEITLKGQGETKEGYEFIYKKR